MIAISEHAGSTTVSIYKSLRGYAGGNTEPVDLHKGATLDDSIAALGFRRVSEWAPIPGSKNVYYARIRA